MKKFLILLSAAMLLVFVGCSKVDNNKNANAMDNASYNGLKVAGLKGPTTMGIVKMMDTSPQNTYEIFGTADEAAVRITKGEIDVALVPANLAAVLYGKTKGQVQIAGINTLGVLYMVEKGNTISSVADLKGKKIIATGKGTTPEYVLNYVLSKNGIDPEKDVTIEYKSEATEVAAKLNSGKGEIALLPQPYVSTVIAKDQGIRMALDLTKEWEKIDNQSALVTGVVVVRTEIANSRKDDLNAFLQDYANSVEFVNTNANDAAMLVEKSGIASAQVAKQAIPFCNIVLITGEDMQAKLNGYFKVLFEQNKASVGGSLPDAGIFYNK